MNYKPLISLSAVVALCPAAFAQAPDAKPLTETDLLKQIEALTPGKAPTPPTPPPLPSNAGSRPAVAVKNGGPSPSLFDSGLGDPLKLGGDKGPKKDKPADASGDSSDDKKKGPTEITALEANFDQKANVAIFIGEVVVKDPEFNVICDKLTAYLKHDDKAKVAGAATTPTPTTPKPVTPSPKGDAAAKDKGGGLDHAIAVTTSDRRVIITQDKIDAEGKVTHSIGKGDRATYDANTGDIVLYGSPDAVQGTNRVQATDPSTVITLNRAGNMKAIGPHKTTIVDTSNDKAAPASSPRPAAILRQ